MPFLHSLFRVSAGIFGASQLLCHDLAKQLNQHLRSVERLQPAPALVTKTLHSFRQFLPGTRTSHLSQLKPLCLAPSHARTLACRQARLQARGRVRRLSWRWPPRRSCTTSCKAGPSLQAGCAPFFCNSLRRKHQARTLSPHSHRLRAQACHPCSRKPLSCLASGARGRSRCHACLQTRLGPHLCQLSPRRHRRQARRLPAGAGHGRVLGPV